MNRLPKGFIELDLIVSGAMAVRKDKTIIHTSNVVLHPDSKNVSIFVNGFFKEHNYTYEEIMAKIKEAQGD